MVCPTARPNTAPGPEAMRFNGATTRRMSPGNRRSADRRRLPSDRIANRDAVDRLVVLGYIRVGVTGLESLVEAMNADPSQEEAVRTSVESCLERFLPMMRKAGVCQADI